MLKCDVCKKLWRMEEMIWDGLGYVCLPCIERENMETKNLEITVKLNGKEVPLDTISTETFEAIKALEKPKEIPVARLATVKQSDGLRLLFKPTNNISLDVGYLYALDLKHGVRTNRWRPLVDETEIDTYYENVKPL